MQEYKMTVDYDGTIRYYKPGTDVLHRIDGPAIVYANGTVEYFIDGKLHRTDGPAVIWSTGYKAWYQDNRLHRIDGPAVEKANGEIGYWIDGKQLTSAQFKNATSPKPKENDYY